MSRYAYVIYREFMIIQEQVWLCDIVYDYPRVAMVINMIIHMSRYGHVIYCIYDHV